MKKVLFVATIASHINSFHIPDLQFFKDSGWEVHVAIGTSPEIRGEKQVRECDQLHIVNIKREPLSIENVKGYFELKKIIDREKFQIIHSHTPMGSVIARISAMKSRRVNGTKSIYTCHGAHFFKGASIKNWLTYYPIEKILSLITDCLIMINVEDYDRALKKLHAKSTEYVPGVGITRKFQPCTTEEKNKLRQRLGYHENQEILFFAGELCQRKNQMFLLNVMRLLLRENRNRELKLLLAGTGLMEQELMDQIKYLNILESVELLGFRNDIDNLLKISDVYVAASKQEGLAVNVMEALGTGIPVVVTKARGQSDLIVNSQNGFIVEQGDLEGFEEKVDCLLNYKSDRVIMSDKCVKSVERYRLENIRPNIEKIYREYM